MVLEDFKKHLMSHEVIDSALIISVITAFSYLLTYIYEVIYMEYFGAGAGSARVEPVPIITTSFIVFGLIALVSVLFFYVLRGVAKEETEWKRMLKGFGVDALFFVVGLIPLFYAEHPDHFRKYLLEQIASLARLLIVMTICVVIYAASRYIVARKRRGHTSPNERVTHPKLISLSLSVVVPPTLILLFFVYSIALPIVAAYNDASFKILTINNTTVAVIREYDDHMVAMQYDPKSNQLMPKYFYIQNDTNLTYTMLHKKPIYVSQYLKQKQEGHSHGLL